MEVDEQVITDHTTALRQRPVYTIPEAYNLARVGRTTLYGEIRAGRLTARKIAGRTLILAGDLESWLQSLPSARVV
ncbi:helix-turn-helix domain-containing protein [Siccirubricoccus sp. KC 17139]|uniref:Helix-turn-helix domain-containing protein n=1 Tax=Siccirubricoccus soli TaxID=2899147 RepID=A0ABT1D1A7_9PROT|nr:helix-turn-helix domain-containing protein [Siccirubricoccus soli]MCO6415700.1 helix-turn-helix domain-containing protein [Siccirubricoccus soli]MCP2681832.1 helix-turn-helix domain-containing protein [Siccirubricoccus soli]